MFDMMLAFVIILIALALAYNYYINVQENQEIYDLNQDILDGFTNTKINSLNDEGIRELFLENKIKNIENTVAQQVIEFYNTTGEEVYAKNLTMIFIKDYLDKQMNFNITLQNDSATLITLFNVSNRDIPIDDATIVSVAKRRIFAFKGKDEFYGPYIFQVTIWK